jgi:hypothetical protein
LSLSFSCPFYFGFELFLAIHCHFFLSLSFSCSFCFGFELFLALHCHLLGLPFFMPFVGFAGFPSFG